MFTRLLATILSCFLAWPCFVRSEPTGEDIKAVFQSYGFRPVRAVWQPTGNYPVPGIRLDCGGQILDGRIDTLCTNSLIRGKAAERIGKRTPSSRRDEGYALKIGDIDLGVVPLLEREWRQAIAVRRPGKSSGAARPAKVDFDLVRGYYAGTFPISIEVSADLVLGADFLRTHGLWLAYVGDSFFVPGTLPAGSPSAGLAEALAGLGYTPTRPVAWHQSAPMYRCVLEGRSHTVLLATSCAETVIGTHMERQLGRYTGDEDNLFVQIFAPNLPARRWRLKGFGIADWTESSATVCLGDLAAWKVGSTADDPVGLLGAGTLLSSKALVDGATGQIFVLRKADKR